MDRLDQLVVKAGRQGLGICKRQLEVAGQFVHSHIIFLNFDWAARKRPGYPRFEGRIPENQYDCKSPLAGENQTAPAGYRPQAGSYTKMRRMMS